MDKNNTLSAKAAVFNKYGIPAKVLECQNWPTAPIGPEDVLVKMQYAPINPADFGTIMGVYGIKRTPPAVGGNEGMGVVESIGPEVRGIKPGDRVAFIQSHAAWCEYVVSPGSNIIPLREKLDAVQASMLSVNPMTSWRLLHDFVKLDSSSLVIQNAANSAVGIMVNQICAHKGWSCLNLVRRKEALDFMEELGFKAFLETEVDFEKINSEFPHKKITLGLNAVGGKSALQLIKLLAPNGVLATYGGADGAPVRFPTRELIFSNIQLRGFWRNTWLSTNSPETILAEYENLQALFEQQVLKIPVAECFSLEELPAAIEAAGYGKRLGKILFKL